MSCEKCRELLWEFLEGELGKDDAAFVSAHLENCQDCQEEAKQLQKIMDSLKNLPEEELPEGYHEELMDRLAMEQQGMSLFVPKKPKHRWKQLSLIAAAVVLVAAIGGVQGILDLRGNQNEVTMDISQENDGSGNDVMMKYSVAPKESGTGMMEQEIVQGEDISYGQGEASKAELQKTVAQEPTDQNEQKASQNAEEVLPEVVSQNAQELTDNTEDEAVAQLPEVQTRSLLLLQGDKAEETTVQQQVILTVEREVGVTDQISELAISLGGYEVERTLEAGIIVSVPLDKAEAFMEGLKKLGETRYLEEISEEIDAVQFEVTLEIK
ncbi:MAG: zf-HC2 domain-containing protein [Anaerotignum sp.]|nr:zf-HC2 domain-containing protein [Anaerotignum sp.]